MAKKHIYQLNVKNKLSQQEEQRQHHESREGFGGCQKGGWCGEWVKRRGDEEVQIGSYRIAMRT